MELYTEIILDHYKNPRYYGVLEKPSASVMEYNVMCGDKVRVDLKVDKGLISDVCFEGNGCAISQASASMLMEKLIGMKIEEIARISNEEIYEMLMIPISPVRVKCALLALMAAKRAAKIVEKSFDGKNNIFLKKKTGRRIKKK